MERAIKSIFMLMIGGREGVGPLARSVFPICLGLCPTMPSIKDCYVGKRRIVTRKVSFRKVLCQSESEFESLSLFSSVFICREEEDALSWKLCPSGVFF